MSAELREKLAAAIAAAKFDEDDYVDPDHLSRAVLVVVESAIESALAVRTEAAAQIIDDEIAARESFEDHVESIDVLRDKILSLSTESEKAWLAHFKAKIGTAALTDLARDGKDLIVGCGKPFRTFSEEALAQHDQQVRQAALRILVQHRVIRSDLVGCYGICSCQKKGEMPVDFETEQDYIEHLSKALDDPTPELPGPHKADPRDQTIAELRSLMPCGHPRACLDENIICAGTVTEDVVIGCTVCCEINTAYHEGEKDNLLYSATIANLEREIAELRESLQFCLEHLPDPTGEDNDAYVAGYALAKQRITAQTRTGSDHE